MSGTENTEIRSSLLREIPVTTGSEEDVITYEKPGEAYFVGSALDCLCRPVGRATGYVLSVVVLDVSDSEEVLVT